MGFFFRSSDNVGNKNVGEHESLKIATNLKDENLLKSSNASINQNPAKIAPSKKKRPPQVQKDLESKEDLQTQPLNLNSVSSSQNM